MNYYPVEDLPREHRMMPDMIGQSASLEAIVQRSKNKLFFPIPPVEDLKSELRYHASRLTFHKLTHSARFLNELLVSVVDKQQAEKSGYLQQRFMEENTDKQTRFRQTWRDEGIGKNPDVLTLARTLFDTRELKRAAFILKSAEGSADCQSSLFLFSYSQYLHGYQRKEEEIYERQKSKLNQGVKITEKAVVNQQAINLLPQLEKQYTQGLLDDLNTYLLGLIYNEVGRAQDASAAFVKALNMNPMLWSAWQELAKLIMQEPPKTDSFEIFSKIKDHWMKNFYLASLLLEKMKLIESFDKYCLDILAGLLTFFRESSHLINQTAQLFYYKKDHDAAIAVFQELLRKDPYRLDGIDIYSNILYVKDNPKDLGAMAFNSFQNNKYTPETNCIIGNYHSLMGEHEKAISYFKNALNLDRSFLAAWTLIGHEYLELKKVPNAIDAYNHAVRIDNKDFRAWYGLGQAYELQGLMTTSIHYYLMAVKTRPRDYRMWNALASAYTRIEKPQEAIKCSDRAKNYKDDEGIALFNLARLYDSLGMPDKAAQYFLENLKRIDDTPTFENDLAPTLLYLVHYFKFRQPEKALEYAHRLYDTHGVEREQAHSLIAEIQRGMGD